jgi:hypothetical protein
MSFLQINFFGPVRNSIHYCNDRSVSITSDDIGISHGYTSTIHGDIDISHGYTSTTRDVIHISHVCTSTTRDDIHNVLVK